MCQGCSTRQRAGMVRPNPTEATYAPIVTSNVPPTQNPTIDIAIAMEHNAEPRSAIYTMSGLHAPGQEMDTRVVEKMPAGLLDMAPQGILQTSSTL